MWSSKIATDLYHFMKNKTKIASVALSKNGRKIAILDNKFCAHVYDYFTCKILCSFDESVANYDPAKLTAESKGKARVCDSPMISYLHVVSCLVYLTATYFPQLIKSKLTNLSTGKDAQSRQSFLIQIYQLVVMSLMKVS